MSSTTTPDAAKREGILRCAIACFAERGFRNTDVQVIADRAGVGKGTVYRYFGNKQDLFWAASLDVTERCMRSSTEAMDKVGPTLEKIRAAALARAEFFENNPEYLEVYAQERAEFHGSVPDSHREYFDQLIDQFAGVLQRGVDAGEIRPVDVRQTIVGLAGLLAGVSMQDCYRLTGDSIGQLVRHAVDIYLEGLRAVPSARDRVEESEERNGA